MKTAAVVVAHPDDETIWCGGTILMHRDWRWTVVALTRGSDPDRSPRFRAAALALGASSAIGDLDDGPEQTPLPGRDVEEAVLSLLHKGPYDLVLTHGPRGEYTRHLRHEEASRAVAALWKDGRLEAREVRMFAYEDGVGRYAPRPVEGAHNIRILPGAVWREKQRIIRDVYGFGSESFEATAASDREAFWCFPTVGAYRGWLDTVRRGR